jgi:hypothetical protein
MEQCQGCKEGGETCPSLNTQAVDKYEELYVDVHCHGGALHWMAAFHALCSAQPALHSSFSVSQYTSGIVMPCCINSTLSMPLLSKKTVAISFLADR